MINIALIGKRGSGKTVFLSQVLTNHKINNFDTYGDLFDYIMPNSELQKVYANKYKKLSKEHDIESTIGITENLISVNASNVSHGEICIWEIGSGIPFDVNDTDFEIRFKKYFSETVGGKSNIEFDGYIFFERAENFGVIEDISYSAFSKRFSTYMQLAYKINKPVLMICTNQKNEIYEERLYKRFKNNFRLNILAHYTFFKIDNFDYINILNAKYILTYFISMISVFNSVKLDNAINKLLFDLKNNIEIIKEKENENE